MLTSSGLVDVFILSRWQPRDIHGSSDEPVTPQDISFDVDDLTPSCHNTIENGHFHHWEARAE